VNGDSTYSAEKGKDLKIKKQRAKEDKGVLRWVED
jgi:hypothetical protein